jgi:prepilin-type N-terminal cleavage/methylation domain-containing protein
MPPKLLSRSSTAANQSGFSLLETILALALLGLAITSMARALVGAAAVMERGCRAGRALVVASAVTDALQVAPAHQVLPGGSMAVGRVPAGSLIACWRVEPLPRHDRLLQIQVHVYRPAERGGELPLARLRTLRPAW